MSAKILRLSRVLFAHNNPAFARDCALVVVTDTLRPMAKRKRDGFGRAERRKRRRILADAVAERFIDSEDDAVKLTESFVLGCTAIEDYLKEELWQVNPALVLSRLASVEGIAIISEKADMLQGTGSSHDVRHASAGELLRRYRILYPMDASLANGLGKIFQTRNEMVHDLGSEIDVTGANVLMTKFAIPFLKKNVGISKQSLEGFDEVAKAAENLSKTALLKMIGAAKRRARRLSKEDIEFRVGQVTNAIRCPACKQLSTNIDVDVDVDVDHRTGEIMGGHADPYSDCRVCGLHLNAVEIETLVEAVDDFFQEGEDIDSWLAVPEGLYEDPYDITDFYDIGEYV